MKKEYDFRDDEVLPVSIVWSKKYAMPVFIVGDSEYNDGGIRQYVPDTGDYAGYFTEVTDLVATDDNANTDVANPPSGPKRKANT